VRCDTCQQDSPIVMRVVIAKDYDRSLARAVYNCPACYEKKESRTSSSSKSASERIAS